MLPTSLTCFLFPSLSFTVKESISIFFDTPQLISSSSYIISLSYTPGSFTMLEHHPEYKILVCPLRKQAVSNAREHTLAVAMVSQEKEERSVKESTARTSRSLRSSSLREAFRYHFYGLLTLAFPVMIISSSPPYRLCCTKHQHDVDDQQTPEWVTSALTANHVEPVTVQTFYPFPNAKWFTVDSQAPDSITDYISHSGSGYQL